MEAVPCDIRGMTLSPSFNHEVEEAFLRRSAPSLFGSSSTIPLPEALPEEVPAIHDDFFATPEDQYSRQPEQPQFVLHVKQEAHDHYEVFQQQPPTQSEGLQQPQDGPMHQEVRFEIVLPTQTSQPPSESSARATGRRQSVVDLVMEKFFPEELLQKQPTSEQPGPETFSANAQDHIALARQSSPKSVVSHSDYATSVSVAPHPATEEPPLPTIVRRKSVSGGSKNRKSDEEVTMAARKRRKSVNDAAFPTPQPSEDAKKVETKPRTTSSSANRLRNRRASLPVLSIVSGKGKLVDFKPAPDTDDEGVRSLEEPLRSTQIQDDEGGAYYGSSEDYSRESSPSEGPSRPKLELREAEVKVTRSGKRRLKWTPELSELFRRAVEKLGPSAVPSAILEEMGVKGLTRGNISSHLQKYRMETKQLQLQRQAEEEHLVHQLHAQQYPFQYGVYPPTSRYAYPGLATAPATHPVAPEYQTSIPPATNYFPGAHLPTTSMGETSTAAEDQTELQLYLNSLGNSTERATSIDPFSSAASTTHELSPGPASAQAPHPLHQAVNPLQHSGTWPEHYGAPTPSYAFPVTNPYYHQPYYSYSCPRPHPRSPPPISVPESPRDESGTPVTTSTVVPLRDSMTGHSSIGSIEPAAQQS